MACCAKFCPSRTMVNGVKSEISFHLFPKCLETRAKWIKAVGRQNWEPTKFTRICSKHFDESSFMKGLSVKKLKSDALPIIFEQCPKRMLKNIMRQDRMNRMKKIKSVPKKRTQIVTAKSKTKIQKSARIVAKVRRDDKVTTGIKPNKRAVRNVPPQENAITNASSEDTPDLTGTRVGALCRYCLTDCQDKKYEETDPEVLMDHLNIFLPEDPLLPKRVCVKCATFLRDVKIFRETVLESHRTLMQAIYSRQVVRNVFAVADVGVSRTEDPEVATLSMKQEIDMEESPPQGCSDPLAIADILTGDNTYAKIKRETRHSRDTIRKENRSTVSRNVFKQRPRQPELPVSPKHHTDLSRSAKEGYIIQHIGFSPYNRDDSDMPSHEEERYRTTPSKSSQALHTSGVKRFTTLKKGTKIRGSAMLLARVLSAVPSSPDGTFQLGA